MSLSHFFFDSVIEYSKLAYPTEVPIACVIVYNDNIICYAHNLTNKLSNPCAHAEVIAIQTLNHFIHEELINYEYINAEATKNKSKKIELAKDKVKYEENKKENKNIELTASNYQNDVIVFSNMFDKHTKNNFLREKSLIDKNLNKEIIKYENNSINHKIDKLNIDKILQKLINSSLTVKNYHSNDYNYLKNINLQCYLNIEPCGMCASLLQNLNIKTYFCCKNDIFGGNTVFNIGFGFLIEYRQKEIIDTLKLFYRQENLIAPENKRIKKIK